MINLFKFHHIDNTSFINHSKDDLSQKIKQVLLGTCIITVYANPAYALQPPEVESNQTTLSKVSSSALANNAIINPTPNVASASIVNDSIDKRLVNSDNTPAVSIPSPSKLSFTDAQQLLKQVSPKIAANNAAITASEFQSQTTQSLNKPVVFLRAQATHYHLDTDVDLTGVKTGINNAINNLASDVVNSIPTSQPLPSLPTIPPILSGKLPDKYNLQRSDTNVGANIVALWPVYTAGRNDALTSVFDARTSEAKADALMDEDILYTTLVKRYFTAQLAIVATYLRDDALNTVQETNYMAKRLLEEGFIAKVDFLEAQVALADAKSEATKARNQAHLAMTALQSLLKSPEVIKPTTPLFVSSKPLPSLTHFQKIALENHPGLKKVDAKYEQAAGLKQLSDTGFKPTVSVYGLHEVDKAPSWLVGVSASWKLWGGIDKTTQISASNAQMEQALLTRAEASDNIRLLVEKNWQDVENARIHYLSLNNNVSLAKELLRLKQRGLVEGVNTTLDVTTAQTKYLKARTEQAAAANDYVQALAALMESCGTPFVFNDYMNSADIHLPKLY